MTDDDAVDRCHHLHKRYMLNSIEFTCVPLEDHDYSVDGTADDQLMHTFMSQPAKVPFDPITGIMEVRFEGTPMTSHLVATDREG